MPIESTQESAEDIDSLYAEDNEVQPPESAEASEEQPSVDEENAEGQTAVVSNKVLGSAGTPKEGEQFLCTVVKTYGEETEIKFSPQGASAPADHMEDANAELDSMNEKE